MALVFHLICDQGALFVKIAPWTPTKALVKIYINNTYILNENRQACQVSHNIYIYFITLAAKPLNKRFWSHLFSKRWVAEGINIGE